LRAAGSIGGKKPKAKESLTATVRLAQRIDQPGMAVLGVLSPGSRSDQVRSRCLACSSVADTRRFAGAGNRAPHGDARRLAGRLVAVLPLALQRRRARGIAGCTIASPRGLAPGAEHIG